VKRGVWAWVRTSIAAGGLGFTAATAAFACLDHAGECEPDAGIVVRDGGEAEAGEPSGSGLGNGAQDCGAYLPDTPIEP